MSDEDLVLNKTEVSRVDLILNKINQIEVCKYVNDCAKAFNNDVRESQKSNHSIIKSADLATVAEELQQLIEVRKHKEKVLTEQKAVLAEMLRRLKVRSEQPDFGKDENIDQREAKVINKINCMRCIASALATLPENDPKTIEEAMEQLEQLEQLSGIRNSEYYNFVPENKASD